MRRFDWNALDEAARRAALARPVRRSDASVCARVSEIIGDVEREGAPAVARWSETLDGAAPAFVELTQGAVAKARARLEGEDLAAIELAVDNVRQHHEAMRPRPVETEPYPGVVCRQLFRPIQSCGLYIPGGAAPLVSTLIMLAEPARAAGVGHRIAVTPPQRGDRAGPAMIAAAALCGLDGLWSIGGAQAIAALAFGAGLPRADKIFGPGNAYVAEAKRQIAARGLAAIDLPAGPSELLVIADAAADAAVVAADLLSQAEHDADAQVILIATADGVAERILRELDRQIETLPRTRIARESINEMRVFVAVDRRAALAIANAYAPEHLSLNVAEPDRWIDGIENAGAIFAGAASGETFGDYLSGPSHVLPTDGAARTFGGVTVQSFMKPISVQTLSASAARALAPAAARLARLEGLEAHARAAERRL
ncbi:MAG: histidinol dehydrogenase [Parvularculaceae bacterium]|nr:histidinol dehydrogenase [Parvularculaceae bacterium]